MSGETTSVTPGSSNGGKLEAERLAGTGRHHRQQIAPFEHRLDKVLLTGPEGVVAEMSPQGGERVRRGDRRKSRQILLDDGSVVRPE